jgi:TldD protein
MLTQLGIDEVFRRALRNGGELAEAFFERTSSHQLTYEDRRLDRMSSGVDSGIGLRVIYGHQSVYGYTTELTRRSLLELADTLSKIVQGKLGAGGPVGFDRVKSAFEHRILKDPSRLSHKERLAYVERADAAARAACSDIKQVSAGYIETLREIEIATSEGKLASDSKQYLTFFTEAVGERDGRTQTSFEGEGGFTGLELFDEHPPEEIARRAARRVELLLGAQPAPAGTMPVVLAAEAGGTMIHEAVGHGLEADLACNGLSVYQGKLGQLVANPLITVIDDGTLPGRRGSYAVDDEGTPSARTVLIENGVLKSYMVDRLSSVKFGLELTGNGRRESYRHKPIVRMTNTYIASGKDDPEKILGQTAKGLYVKAMGGGQVNTVTGDFVFAVTEGYLIMDGELGPAVRGATLTGNGPDVLRRVDRVGRDLGFAIGTCGKDGQRAPVTDAQPTIRIPEITVGGETPMSTYWKG